MLVWPLNSGGNQLVYSLQVLGYNQTISVLKPHSHFEFHALVFGSAAYVVFQNVYRFAR